MRVLRLVLVQVPAQVQLPAALQPVQRVLPPKTILARLLLLLLLPPPRPLPLLPLLPLLNVALWRTSPAMRFFRSLRLCFNK